MRSAPRHNRRIVLGFFAAGAAAVLALKLWDWFGTPLPERRIRRSGAKGPRVLCVHGLFASSAFWEPFARELQPDHRVAAPDLLGFGASPKPEDGAYDVAAHLEWLRPLVEEPGEPWIVAGHSMGTVIAAHIALRWPERVRAVVLFNAPVYSSPKARREIFGRQNMLTRASTRSKVLGRVICEVASCLMRPLMRHIGPTLRPDVPPNSARDYFSHNWQSFDRSLDQLLMERDLVADMTRVQRPLLVVQGGADAIVESPDRIGWPANATLRVLPGEDHTSLLFRSPAAAAAILREFATQL